MFSGCGLQKQEWVLCGGVSVRRRKEHVERFYMSDQEESRGIEDLAMAQHNIELNIGCGPCNTLFQSLGTMAICCGSGRFKRGLCVYSL